MKLLVVFLSLLLYVCANDEQLFTEQQWAQLMQNESVTPETRGIIMESQAKKAIKNCLKQFPCGWPEYGIPPLAPYTNADLTVHLAKSVLETFIQMMQLRCDGLDKMEIKKIKIVNTPTKKFKFHFNFPFLKATAALLNTNTTMDALKQLGLEVRYLGSGPMAVSLENLSIKGQFKYKMPLFAGSIKISKLEVVITLGVVRCNIGILRNDKFNTFTNHQIENIVPALINGNQEEISAMIEEYFEPRINDMLKGKKFWSLLGMLSNTKKKCKAPPTPPWMVVEN